MGNEASLEGGEGALAGLPAGLATDGKGGFIQMPAGVEADLSNLSEEERKQLVAAMAKAQSRQVEVSINVCRYHDDDVRPSSARALVLDMSMMCLCFDQGTAG